MDRGNQTIAAAAANYEAARALVRESRVAIFPNGHNEPGNHKFQGLHRRDSRESTSKGYTVQPI